MIADTIEHIKTTLKSNADKIATLGMSFGKDSTVLLDMVFRAYLQDNTLPPLHVLYADTGLEAPTMKRYVSTQIERVRTFIMDNNLPIQFHIARPAPNYTMWTRIIGHGYMQPLAKVAHWCTTSLKLNPLSTKMQTLMSGYNKNQILALVGVREQESGARKVSIDSSMLDADNHLMQSRKNKKEILYAPIRLWSDADVWGYINNGLVFTDPAAIREVYNVTDSCGGSLRSGCVYCPVVRRDKNLEAEADRDPALRFVLKWRNYLARLADPSYKQKLRHFRRQRGDVAFYLKKAKRKSDQDTWEFQRGYYPQRIREHFLRVVLHAQMMTQRRMPDFEWISRQELDTIRQIWLERHGEIEDSMPIIYYSVYRDFYEDGTKWEIEAGVHRWFRFQDKEQIPASWSMVASEAPEIDAERLLRTAHAANDQIENIAFKQARGAWCDDHMEQAKDLIQSLHKTDWRSEVAARRELTGFLARGEEPPKSMPIMGLESVLGHLRSASLFIQSEQDRQWMRLLDMYDRIPEEKRTAEMRSLVQEGLLLDGDPRQKGQMSLALAIRPLGHSKSARRTHRAVVKQGWVQPDLLVA